MVKVITGLYKGRNLLTPASNTIPTKGSVKEAIFSSIANSLQNSNILDIFAGSGAYGIEALSRGARWCIFNDINDEPNKVLKENIKNLKIENCNIYKDDYKVFLEGIKKLKYISDIVFLDPPYVMDVYEEILSFLDSNELISERAILIFESNHSLDLEKYKEKYKITEKKYGYTLITYIKK